jgi:predicted bacteriocin transport accessory protein
LPGGDIMRNKKLILTLLIIKLLTSCANETTYSYSDIEHLEIAWNNIFFIAKPDYLIFIYSESCSHCQELTNEIIPFSLAGKYPTYYVKFTNEIPISSDVSDTYFKTKVEEIKILGTPSLLRITDGILVLNIAGTNDIKNFLKNQ